MNEKDYLINARKTLSTKEDLLEGNGSHLEHMFEHK